MRVWLIDRKQPRADSTLEQGLAIYRRNRGPTSPAPVSSTLEPIWRKRCATSCPINWTPSLFMSACALPCLCSMMY